MERTTSDIINYSTAIFIKNGCKRVTMDNIASELHISKRTLYEHFENKEALLIACLDNIYNHLKREYNKIEKEIDEPILLAMFLIKNTAMRARQLSTFLRDINRYYPTISVPMLRTENADFLDNVRHTLQQAEREGLLRPNLNIETTMHIVKEIMGNSRNREEAYSARQGLDRYLATLSEIGYTFIRGLLSAEAIKRYDEEEIRYRNKLDTINEDGGDDTDKWWHSVFND